MGTRRPSLPIRRPRPSVTPAVHWWRRGWVVDQEGSALWEPCPREARPEARELAARYRGRVVRLLRLPEGCGVDEWDDARTIAPDERMEAVVSVGWPGAPPIPEGAVLIGPVESLLAAERREGIGRGGVDWFRIAVWAGGLAFSLLVWLALFVAIRALVG